MPSPMKTWWLTVTLLVPSLVLYLYVDEPKIQNQETTEPKVAARELASSDAKQLFSPEAGARYIYEFSRKIEFGGLENAPEVSYGGAFFVDVHSVDKNEFTASISEHIRGVTVKSAQYMRAQISRTGTELKIYANKPADPVESQHQDALRDLLSYWVFPAQRDTLGPYRAKLQLVQDTAETAKYAKSKLAYLSSEKIVPKLEKSQQEIIWNKKLGLPSSIQSTEKTSYPGSQLKISALSEMKIEFLRKEKIPGDSSSSEALPLASLEIQHRSVSHEGHPDYENLSWSILSRELAELGHASGPDKLKLFGNLVKLLRKDPSALQDLLSMLTRDILKEGAQSDIFRTIVGTLATLGTSESMAALRNIYQDPDCSTASKSMIQSAISTTQAKVDNQTVNFLISESQQGTDPGLQRGAAYALGSSIQNTSSSSALQAGLNAVMNGWNTAKAQSDLSGEITYLGAIGNSGRSELLPILNDVIQGNYSQDLQARAIFSLRFINTPAATQTLVSELSSTNANFRMAAVQALQVASWQEGYRQPLLQCSNSDSVTGIRNNCSAILRNAPQSNLATR